MYRLCFESNQFFPINLYSYIVYEFWTFESASTFSLIGINTNRWFKSPWWRSTFRFILDHILRWGSLGFAVGSRRALSWPPAKIEEPRISVKKMGFSHLPDPAGHLHHLLHAFAHSCSCSPTPRALGEFPLSIAMLLHMPIDKTQATSTPLTAPPSQAIVAAPHACRRQGRSSP
jgi:hypothetical protein